MIILSANNINKSFGSEEVLKDVSFHVNEGDRIGMTGLNGAGKTTLLNILSAELEATSGDFFIAQDKTIGFLRQKDGFLAENTVYEEAEAEFNRKSGYEYKSYIKGILSSMAFGEEHYDKKISLLSGGERTRLALACLLLKKPDILFLDEPTNHLDIGTLKWLEQYLRSYSGSILLISHDRYFLDQIVNRIFELENRKLRAYDGNYSSFADKKRALREEEMRQYENYRREIERQEEIVRRFKQHGTEKLARRALSREKRLKHIEAPVAPAPEAGKMKIRFKQLFKSGNDVLLCEGLSKGFGSGAGRKELFRDVEFDIKSGEKICIVGANGIGKTTLLKIMIGEIEADRGFINKGHNVLFGFYDQRQAYLTDDNTVLEELKDSYRLYTDTEMRSILGRFLFKGDSVFQTIKSLSGGEKARLSLVKLMLSGANTLVLDEPTNHLDIASKEVFEDAVKEFPGTVVAVSHDRYFLSKIPDRIFELCRDGITAYMGAYDYYTEKKQAIASGRKYLGELGGRTQGRHDTAGEKARRANEQRMLNKKKEGELRREARQKSKLESEIHELEAKIADTEAEMYRKENLSDHILLAEYSKTLCSLKKNIEEKYAEWLELHEK